MFTIGIRHYLGKNTGQNTSSILKYNSVILTMYILQRRLFQRQISTFHNGQGIRLQISSYMNKGYPIPQHDFILQIL